MAFCARYTVWLVIFALGGCSLPAPYQTYSPGAAPPPPPPQNPLTVYGSATPDSQIDFGSQDSAAGLSFIPAPTPPPAASPSAGDQTVAICYSRLWNSAEAVRNAALQACGNKGASRIVRQGLDLNACPLMTPTQAVFTCSAGP